ncbi:MAG: hypothetical protein DRR06_15595 [Gammaproteobacteria bacterium]|nr:MAG: hypothetical protein DRR06_15595 [Gammaproteobacteria bacterium]RLA46005.1 MAG: hypothetical protein DRR42_18800 [Gammaproteobacteria bacterium]
MVPLAIDITIVPGGRKVVEWDANGDQADYIYVEDSGQGGRCLYQFDAVSSGSFLEPASNKVSVTACWDGENTVVPEPPKEPISSLDGRCDGDLQGIQEALDGGQGELAMVATEDENGEYLPGICAAGGQTRCVNQCIAPTTTTYDCPETLAAGERCLSDRACATADELVNGTGEPGVDQFCWELSHAVDTDAGTFMPVTAQEKATFSLEGIKGSHCRLVTTSYRGRVYSYYSPSGCPSAN